MGVMLDSIRYRLYAIESETSEPSGTMARIILEDAEDRLRLGGGGDRSRATGRRPLRH